MGKKGYALSDFAALDIRLSDEEIWHNYLDGFAKFKEFNACLILSAEAEISFLCSLNSRCLSSKNGKKS